MEKVTFFDDSTLPKSRNMCSKGGFSGESYFFQNIFKLSGWIVKRPEIPEFLRMLCYEMMSVQVV